MTLDLPRKQPNVRQEVDTEINRTMMAHNAPPSYHEVDPELTKSQEAAGEQHYGSATGISQPVFYTHPNLQPAVQQVPVTGIDQPPHPGPPDYLLFALITMIVCGLMNLTSLFFGIPAVVFAALSHATRTSYKARDFKNAQSYSNIALGLTVGCIIYTLLWAVILAGVCVYYFRSYPYRFSG